jgi:hypothetical protein
LTAMKRLFLSAIIIGIFLATNMGMVNAQTGVNQVKPTATKGSVDADPSATTLAATVTRDGGFIDPNANAWPSSTATNAIVIPSSTDLPASPTPEPATQKPQSTILPATVTPVTTTKPSRHWVFWLVSFAAFVCLVLMVVLIVRENKKRYPARPGQQFGAISPSGSFQAVIDQARDPASAVMNPISSITVLQSDDLSMIGQKFDITDQICRLGRAADNEVFFPREVSISNHHCIIEHRAGQFVLSEVMGIVGDGGGRKPLGGTFVNEHLILSPTVIKNGDMIRLGNKLVFRFEQPG